MHQSVVTKLSKRQSQSHPWFTSALLIQIFCSSCWKHLEMPSLFSWLAIFQVSRQPLSPRNNCI